MSKLKKNRHHAFYTKGRRRTKKQRVLHVTSKTIRVQLSTYIRIYFYQYNPLNMLARSFTARKEKNEKLLIQQGLKAQDWSPIWCRPLQT